MRYKLLGKTGIRVSEFSLGAMTFGTDWKTGADKDESKKIFDTYINAGGNFIDTANVYTKHTSEKYLGEFIQSERSNLVISSKYTLSESNKINQAGNHHKNMIESVNNSLKRLQTDYIDLYYVHIWDFTVGEQELMKNLEYLVSSGKVLSLGFSDTPAYITARCNTIAELRGWTELAAYQIEYCLSERTSEREIIPHAEHSNMSVCAWGPIGAGLLTGKYLKEDNEPKRMTPGKSLRLTKENLQLSAKVVELAKMVGCTPAQLALYWVKNQSPQIITLFGSRTAKQCAENLGALSITVDQEIMDELEEASKIDLGFPSKFYKTGRVMDIAYGGHRDKIDF